MLLVGGVGVGVDGSAVVVSFVGSATAGGVTTAGDENWFGLEVSWVPEVGFGG